MNDKKKSSEHVKQVMNQCYLSNVLRFHQNQSPKVISILQYLYKLTNFALYVEVYMW